MVGYLQKQIIKIGKEKGFVTSDDVKLFYSHQFVEREMNKLVALEYFEKSEDCVAYIKWKFKKK